MTLYLIDASSYQSALPVESLPGQGFSALIVKSTEGTGYVNPSFSDFITRCKRIGFPCAAYHFVHVGSADAQAALIAQTVPKDVPVWMDAEAGATVADAVAVANGVTRRGLTVAGIYSGSNPGGSYGWWRAAYLSDPSGYASSVYQAQGGDSGSGWVSGVDIWQYCQHGRVSGYSGDVDFSAYRGTAAQLAASGWFWTPPHPTPPPTPKPTEDEMFVSASNSSTDKPVSVVAGMVFQVGAGYRHWINDPAAWAELVKGGASAVPMSGDHIRAQWSAVSPVAPIDPAALAAAVSAAVHPTVDAQAVATALAPLLHAGATVDDIRTLLGTLKITAG